MAAFVDGKLAPGEVALVAGHLRECADCRTVVGETARWEREREEVTRPRWTNMKWGAIAAMLAGAIALSLPLLQKWREPDPIQLLVDAAPREHRTVTARLSGFRWARVQPQQRGAPARDPANLQLQGTVGDVLEQMAQKQDVESLHAAGLAHLLSEDIAKSIDTLERAAAQSSQASIWNDLAAARFTLAFESDRPAEYPEALTDADHAIQLDPAFAPASFNRALILEHMGDREAARKAWEHYLQLDPSSDWSNEARQHLRTLSDLSSASDFKTAQTNAHAALKAGNGAAVVQLVRQYPESSRRMGAWRLTQWGQAESAGDPAGALEHLTFARAIAEAFLRQTGDALLLDTVSAIDGADPATRGSLARALALFDTARTAYREGRQAEAAAGFTSAEAQFRAAGSSFADVAAYFGAGAALNNGREAEAANTLEALRARIDHDRYPALSAELDYDLARAATRSGDWGSAARMGTSAATKFRKLGETGNAGITDGIAAHALERIGERDMAWRRRIGALGSIATDIHRRAVWHSAAIALAAHDHVAAANAVLDVLTEDGRDNPEFYANTLTDRARFAELNGDGAAAGRWLREARAAAAGIQDAAPRKKIEAQIEVAAAILQRGSDPGGAVASLDRAIRTFSEPGAAMRLPDAYLQRARAHRAAGNDAAALADYRAARQKYEEQQKTADGVSESIASQDVAAAVIEETIELHLDHGAVAEAFAVAEGTRALDGTSPLALPVPQRVAVIGYALLPKGVAIFCITGDRIHAERVPLERRALEARIVTLSERIRAKAPIDLVLSEATALHDLLIRPIGSHLASVDELVIIPDRQLHALPFGVLYDGRTHRHLVQDYAIRSALSASRAPRPKSEALSPATIVGDPFVEGWARLPYGQEEARDVTAVYTKATLITGRQATRARFIDALTRSAVVHYTGHADSNVGESYGALLLASADGNDGLLSTGDIARLPLRASSPLVVLSACGTFRGETTHVAGMPSLARAFLKAGARGVVGTLWEIEDDKAAALFVSFHRNLHAGLAPARALQSAQIEMLQKPDPRLSHPSTWSPIGVLSNL